MSKMSKSDLILRASTAALASMLLLFAFESMAQTETATANAKRARKAIRKQSIAANTTGQRQALAGTAATTGTATAKRKTILQQTNAQAAKSAAAGQAAANTAIRHAPPEDGLTTSQALKAMDAELPVKTTVKKPEEKSKPLSFEASISKARSSFDKASDHYQEGTSIKTALGVSINDWTYTTKVSYGFDDVDRDKSDFGDVALQAAPKPMPISNSFVFAPSMVGVMPTSKDSSQRVNQYGALGVIAGFNSKPDAFYNGFGMGFSISLSRLFNQYTTSVDDKVNKQWSSKQKMAFGYTYKDTVGVSIEFIHAAGLDYNNDISQGFAHAEEIGWNVTKNFSLALGHSLEGSVYKPNTRESNINLVDSDDSVTYVSMGVSF